jgi:Mrp family chromosome partitioning ATPase
MPIRQGEQEGYFMSKIENSRNKEPKKHTGESPQVQSLQESMKSISHKFVVMSSQGGVGKTSVLVNLALALAKRGVKIGLMDANYHGPDIHRMLGLEAVIEGNSKKRFMLIACNALPISMVAVKPLQPDRGFRKFAKSLL